MQKANVERDPKIDEEVLRLYRDTCRKSVTAKAMHNLVFAYLQGKGTPIDHGQAIYWTDKMIEADIGSGYYLMAQQIRDGIAPEQKLGIWAYYRRSADLGYSVGQYAVGRKFVGKFNQTPVARASGWATGLKMLRCSLEQGFAPAGEKTGVPVSQRRKTTQHRSTTFNVPERWDVVKASIIYTRCFEETKVMWAISTKTKIWQRAIAIS